MWGAPFSVSFGAGDTLTFRGNTVFCPEKFRGNVFFVVFYHTWPKDEKHWVIQKSNFGAVFQSGHSPEVAFIE